MKNVKFGNIPETTRQMTEAMRTLRTNIQFCGDDVKVILFTSSAPNEGKSSVIFKMAQSLVETEKKVLLIDADIRKSVFVSKYKVKSLDQGQIYGLSHYLSGQRKLEEVVCETSIPDLYMIFAGPSVPNPTEILDNHYFEELIQMGRENYDYVLIDCPPMGTAIDAAVIAKQADGAVLIVAQGQMPTRAVVDAKNQLQASGVRILGAVLNKAKVRYSGYYGSYYGGYYGGYYGSYYGNYYGEDRENEEGVAEKPVRKKPQYSKGEAKHIAKSNDK